MARDALGNPGGLLGVSPDGLPPARPRRLMVKIQLTKGYAALVDAADVLLLAGRRWQAFETHSGIVYAKSSDKVFMHRLLMPGVLQIDHKNRNGLDNRRLNLRPASAGQNGANSRRKGARRRKDSGFKGVWWDPERQKWAASIGVARRKVHLGRFERAEDAARAYDQAARAYFAEYARPNFA